MRRKGKIVEIIANNPAEGQSSIAHLIGRQFGTWRYDPEDRTVSVRLPELPALYVDGQSERGGGRVSKKVIDSLKR